MPFDGFVTRSLKNELNLVLGESRIDKIYQPNKSQIILRFKSGRDTHKLLISANSSLPYVALTKMDKKNPATPPLFCMVLRKHLQGGFLKEIIQHDNDRILFLDFQTRDELKFAEKKRLVVELMGKHSNIILTDSENRIIDSIRRVPSTVSRQRQVLPGLTYRLPPDQGKINHEGCSLDNFHDLICGRNTEIHKAIYTVFKGISPILAKEFCFRTGIEPDMLSSSINKETAIKLYGTIFKHGKSIDSGSETPTVFTEKGIPKDFHAIDLEIYPEGMYGREHFDSVSDAIDRYYLKRNEGSSLRAKSANLHKFVKSRLVHSKNKLQKLHEEYTQSLDYGKFKVYGDVLLANIHKIETGMESIVLDNFYDENRTVEIPLDKQLSPSKNAQKYFKRYNKFKNAKLHVHKQIILTEEEIEYLENVLVNLENSFEIENIDAIRHELVKAGYISGRFTKNQKAGKSSKTDKFNKTHMTFKTRNGKRVIAGKNSTQNERVTFKKSQPDDFWFHAKDMPGSHVVLVNDGSLTDGDYSDAAMIAAYYSKGRMSSNVPVDCTKIKNVKKIKGAGPGLVTYVQQNTIYVTPDERTVMDFED